MRNAFKHFNKDKNHFISFENFARTLREFELKLPPADIEALFRRYDRCVPRLLLSSLFALVHPTSSTSTAPPLTLEKAKLSGPVTPTRFHHVGSG
jgi:hypothetical protein